MVFITAGMGGGTGTGAAPVIARMARERGVLTVGVVTKPFDFEGPKRRRASDAGIEELQSFVDTLIIIPNQNLFRMANERTTFAEAFKLADEVLYDGVRGVTDLMIKPGLVNLDFADIRTVMAEMGKAMMGTGEADGDDRAVKAAERAISNPLLDDASLRGARGVLINITGGYDMTLFEVDEAANRIRKEVDEDAQHHLRHLGRGRPERPAAGLGGRHRHRRGAAAGRGARDRPAGVRRRSPAAQSRPDHAAGRPPGPAGHDRPAHGRSGDRRGGGQPARIGAPRVAAPVRGGACAAPPPRRPAWPRRACRRPARRRSPRPRRCRRCSRWPMPAATVHPAPLVDAQRRPAGSRASRCRRSPPRPRRSAPSAACSAGSPAPPPPARMMRRTPARAAAGRAADRAGRRRTPGGPPRARAGWTSRSRPSCAASPTDPAIRNTAAPAVVLSGRPCRGGPICVGGSRAIATKHL